MLDARPGDVRRHLSGIARAQDLIDFKPAMDLQTGLANTVEYYRKVRRDGAAAS